MSKIIPPSNSGGGTTIDPGSSGDIPVSNGTIYQPTGAAAVRAAISAAKSGSNSDITALTGLTGASTATMATDVCPLTLKGKSSGQTAHLQEWRRGSDNVLLGYAESGENGDYSLHYIILEASNGITSGNTITSFNTISSYTNLFANCAAINTDPGAPLLKLEHASTSPTSDFIRCRIGAAGAIKFTVDVNGNCTTQTAIVPAITAPSAPASGWVIYCDSGDSNKLKAKAANGTTVTLGTP